MIPTMNERIIASIVLIAAFAVLAKMFGVFKQRSARRREGAQMLPGGIKIEAPTLLYFWSTGCAQCVPQERQIEHAEATLKQDGKTFKVLKLNALDEQTLASSMHVLTVPTTVLIDAQGRVAAWNPGLTPWRTIVEQYHTIG
jgi:hypothetical protein